MRYEPDSSWLQTKPRRGGMGNYSGYLSTIGIEGEVLGRVRYLNGEQITESGINERSSSEECEIIMEVTWTEVCVRGHGCTVSEIQWVEYEVCSPGGGPSHSSGGEPGGDTGGGGAGPTPVGGGDPGFIDPVDVSYYLSPIMEGEDLSNPYDGMKAVDSNGIVYTYDASLNAWLLPDIAIMEDNDYTFNFDVDPASDGFDGMVLSTLTVVAIIEPTPIGEVLLGGTILVIVAYEWYQVNTARYDEALSTHCTDLYVLCRDRYGVQNLDCSTCLQFCNVQGYWDFVNCPLRD